MGEGRNGLVHASLLPEDVEFLADVRAYVGARMFGLDGVINALLAALVTGGHVLLEGNPGLGKTELVKALSDSLAFPRDKIGRIQFTPDLMPADITGTLMPKDDDPRQLAFKPGPIFRWLLLADEINRATPKTQAAMLEAMAEKQVTVLNETYSLIEHHDVRFDDYEYQAGTPFMVMATQNPIDLEGTYDLPEAQSDRFMFKIVMPFPDGPVLGQIIDKVTGVEKEPDNNDRATKPPVADFRVALVRLKRIGDAVRAARPGAAVRQHVLNLILASNGKFDATMRLDRSRQQSLKQFVDDYIVYPLGPRAAFALLSGALAWEAVALTESGDVDQFGTRAAQGLAHAVLPALRHRLKLRLDWERRYRQRLDKPDSLDRVQLHHQLLSEFVTLSAPNSESYPLIMKNAMDAILKTPI